MKTLLLILSVLFLFSCQQSIDTEKVKDDVFASEKAFEKMAADSGIATAFYEFADNNAVIKRQNDTLIIGKENIKKYYSKANTSNATVNWTPDSIYVSDDGSMAWTFGKYVWKVQPDSGEVKEYKGVFHTVWKRQADKSWKYVWD